MADFELLTIKIEQMTIESTNDNTPTTPAITYSECYVQPLRGYRLQQHNKSDLEYLQEWIDLKTSKSDETATMVIEKITDMLKQKKRYKSLTQTEKNIAWFLPRPKKDRYRGGKPLYCEEWLIELAKDILGKEPNLLNLNCIS